MGNRLTFHGGYRNKNGKAYNTKHNQREDFAKKGKEGEEKQNIYWDYTGLADTFSGSEREFYKVAFGNHVKHQNEKHKKGYHPERCKTIDQYREAHPPEEVLLYIGTKDVNPDVLKKVFDDFRKYTRENFFDEEKKCGIRMLNAALHMDETTPHIHFRQVYFYTDKNGDLQVSQTKALAGLGIDRPDPTSKESRMNNAKQTFTAMCREKLFEIAKSYGVELTTEPLPKNEVGLPINEYRAREQAREAWQQEKQEIEAEKEEMLEAVEEAKRDINDIEDFKAFQKDKREREASEKAEQEAEEARKKAEQKRHEIITRRNIEREAQVEQSMQNAREWLQNAPESTETIYAIPDTLKALNSLRNDSRPIRNDARQAYNNLSEKAKEAATADDILNFEPEKR